MSEGKSTAVPKSVASVWPALLILAFGAGIWFWAGDYSGTARRFPRIVSAILCGLALIDLWSRLPLPGRKFIDDFWGTSFARREMTHVPTLRAELVLTAWIVAAFAGMAVFGILPALPVFCFAYAWLKAGRPVGQAALVAVVLLGFEYAVFEWLLNYDLYRGLLFSKGGLARW